MAGSRNRRARPSAKKRQQLSEAATAAVEEAGKVPQALAAGAGGGRGRAIKFTPSQDEVLAAIDSLYIDMLKPFGRLIRKRIDEVAAQRGDEAGVAEQAKATGVDPAALRAVCEECSSLQVAAEEGGEWSVVVVGRAPTYIDVCSNEDWYPSDLWKAAEAYFESEDGQDLQLPGGRYSCAQALLEKDLPFLRFYSLGQVCHIVQLAISQKKLLGYLSGSVVPYRRSQSMVKERLAKLQQAGTDSGCEDALAAADWEKARVCLREIVESVPPEGISLSNIKRFFRDQFNTELSETALGHSRLSDLLQDARFSDVCLVKLGAQGYTVHPVQVDSACVEQPTQGAGNCEHPEGSGQRQGFCPDEPLPLDDLITEGAPFIATLSPSPFLMAPRKAMGAAPLNACAEEQVHLISTSATGAFAADLYAEVPDLTFMMQNMFAAWTSPGLFPNGTTEPCAYDTEALYQPSIASQVLLGEAALVSGGDLLTSFGSSTEWATLPTDVPATVPVNMALPMPAHKTNEYAVRDSPPAFCPDEPLSLDDEDLFQDDVPALPAIAARTPIRLTPSSRATIKSTVRNTFIHAPLPPTTPTPGSRRRSSSVPKDCGSARAILELSSTGARTPMCTDRLASPACMPPTPALVFPPTPLFPDRTPRHSETFGVMAGLSTTLPAQGTRMASFQPILRIADYL